MTRLIPVCLLSVVPAIHAATIEIKPGSSVASLAQARDEARKLREAGERGAITVRIADGVYQLPEPVAFEPRDSGVTYEAVAGAKPVFVGGRKVAGFKQGNDGIWTTHLPSVEGKEYFEALWVNGKRATQARTPNDGYIQGLKGSPKPIEGIPDGGEADRTLIQVAPGEAAFLKGLDGRELRDVNALVYHSWDVDRRRVAGVRVEDGTLQFAGSGIRPFFFHEHRI